MFTRLEVLRVHHVLTIEKYRDRNKDNLIRQSIQDSAGIGNVFQAIEKRYCRYPGLPEIIPIGIEEQAPLFQYSHGIGIDIESQAMTVKIHERAGADPDIQNVAAMIRVFINQIQPELIDLPGGLLFVAFPETQESFLVINLFIRRADWNPV